MHRPTYTHAVRRWELLLAVLAIGTPAVLVPNGHEKAAGARFETDSDGRAQDRFNDQGASSA